MNTIFSCATGAWAPFEDPKVGADEDKQLLILKERVNDWIGKEQEAGRPYDFHPSNFETTDKQLMRILRRCGHDIEVSYNEWVDWVKFRAEAKANEIKLEDFAAHLTPLGLAEWRGQDKEGRPSLVLTGRLLRQEFQFKSVALFRKYTLHMAETGVHMLDEKELEHACILYDRRMLDFEHCDPDLHTGCKEYFDNIRRFYGDRIGNVYILNMNWLFYSVFSFLLKPLLNILQKAGSKMHAVQKPAELSQWFDDEHLLLNETHLENLEPEAVAYETEEVLMDPTYGIKTEGVRLAGGMIITGVPTPKAAPAVLKVPTTEPSTTA
jgi:hypothetical protein